MPFLNKKTFFELSICLNIFIHIFFIYIFKNHHQKKKINPPL